MKTRILVNVDRRCWLYFSINGCKIHQNPRREIQIAPIAGSESPHSPQIKYDTGADNDFLTVSCELHDAISVFIFVPNGSPRGGE
ncbi:MAG: hypothetical protein CMJ80_14485 [Planctomycetaceae bacterium]|nr:hypothetical protein [Planctomycetaceae bacterium]